MASFEVVRVVLLLFCATYTCMGQSPSQQDVNDLLDINAEFGVEIYKRMALESDNVFLSPYSLIAALGMTYLGARGTTKSTMESVIGYSNYQDRVAPVLQMAREHVHDPTINYVLKEANRIFTNPDTELLRSYLTSCQNVFNAGVGFVNFERNQQAIEAINSWVARNTNNMITDLLKSTDVDASTTLVLVNALYFQANWADVFDRDMTRLADFNVGGFEVINNHPLMYKSAYFYTSYQSDIDADVVRLPYEDERISMYAFLPRPNEADPMENLMHMESQLTAEYIRDAISSMTDSRIRLSFPKFNITHQTSVKEILTGMGLSIMFDRQQADFTGIGGSELPLTITDVIHQGKVSVDEVGTSAAAATAVVMTRRLPRAITFDVPFMFIIYARRDNDDLGPESDLETGRGNIVFMGRVVNPSDTEQVRAFVPFPPDVINDDVNSGDGSDDNDNGNGLGDGNDDSNDDDNDNDDGNNGLIRRNSAGKPQILGWLQICFFVVFILLTKNF